MLRCSGEQARKKDNAGPFKRSIRCTNLKWSFHLARVATDSNCSTQSSTVSPSPLSSPENHVTCGSGESIEDSPRGGNIHVGRIPGRELPARVACVSPDRVSERGRGDRSTGNAVPGLGGTTLIPGSSPMSDEVGVASSAPTQRSLVCNIALSAFSSPNSSSLASFSFFNSATLPLLLSRSAVTDLSCLLTVA